MVSFRQRKIDKNLKILGDKDSSRRMTAIKLLAKMGTSAVNQLVQALDDGEPVIRESAAIALGRIGDQNTVPPMLVAIQNEESGQAKAKMIAALGEIIGTSNVNHTPPHSGMLPRPTEQAKILAEFGEGVVEPLLDAIVNAKGSLRIDAMWALGIKGNKRAEIPLMKCLMEGDSLLRLEAIGALGRLKSAQAAEPLVKIVEDTNEPYYARWTAASALGQIASTDTVAPLIRVLLVLFVELVLLVIQ